MQEPDGVKYFENESYARAYYEDLEEYCIWVKVEMVSDMWAVSWIV